MFHYSVQRAAQEHMKTGRKRAPPPLHVSLHRIEEEKRKLAQRTKEKLASLLTKRSQTVPEDAQECDIQHGDMRVTPSHSMLIQCVCVCGC